MLVVFHSKPAAEVLMFAQHALPILKAAGKPYTDTLPERGVITREQLADAIAGIERAIAEGPALDHVESDDENDDREHPISQPVSFRQRSFPLLAMLRLAQQHQADVTWEPAPSW
ncbi:MULTISPECIES: DUF1840 domain-containing protein [Pusillimonas]|uniref:DUF1840 domain-containing protein n=1 Tax=Pusillimonas TaxID=305976 RepID=UPI000E59EDFA|nr:MULTISPECIES: DUF1840 domain-containing protein [Pusillimonas]MDX3894548.1 DUF1840 domain-containing protein [Pusillimonas sp.]TFL09377.1 DUF1840 domain-containing protein [Pusillimonas caeni]